MITQRSRAGRYAPGWSGSPAGPEAWKLSGLCRQVDPELWFPEQGGSSREAKRVCAGCPVRAECLEYALERDERFGIWGGLSEQDRQRLRRTGDMPAPRPVPAGRNRPVACDCGLPSCSGLVARETARRHRARAEREHLRRARTAA